MRFGLNRRGLLRGAALPAVALPVVRRNKVWAAAEKTIVFVPEAMPASLDPIATPSFATRTASTAVFETLYGTDARLNAVPQMVDKFRMEDDGRTWVFQLRSGLWFHDGTKVTARDCVASLRRWMRRDRVGHALGARLDVIEAPSDDTLRLRLGRPLPRVPVMLAKSQMSPPVIMPARFADTSTETPVDGVVGSGPFRVGDLTWHPGGDLDLLRFERYQPRTEASGFTGGGRVVLLDRVLWRTPEDPVKALRDGSADWVEWVAPELAGAGFGDPNVIAGQLDDVGYYAMLRLNTLRGPTANQRVRQAILAGVDQTAVMVAVFGDDVSRFRAPIGLFPPGSEFVTTAGNERIGATKSPRAIRTMLKDAGYEGEPIVILDPVDDIVHTRLTAAAIEELRQIGLTVERRTLDRYAFAAWRSGNAARGSRPVPAGPAMEGTDGHAAADWSALCDSVPCADHYDPFAISAGPPPAGGLWPGWPDDPAAARLREAWIDAGDLTTQRAIAGQLQVQVFTTAAFVPLGQWFPTAAWRKTVTGLQKGSFPVFWDVARQ
jgi:peptide/nickel transport system substrate-binding protein